MLKRCPECDSIMKKTYLGFHRDRDKEWVCLKCEYKEKMEQLDNWF